VTLCVSVAMDSSFSEFGNDSACYAVSDVREVLGSNPGDTAVYCTT
jgi:hypothetical protein